MHLDTLNYTSINVFYKHFRNDLRQQHQKPPRWGNPSLSQSRSERMTESSEYAGAVCHCQWRILGLQCYHMFLLSFLPAAIRYHRCAVYQAQASKQSWKTTLEIHWVFTIFIANLAALNKPYLEERKLSGMDWIWWTTTTTTTTATATTTTTTWWTWLSQIQWAT